MSSIKDFTIGPDLLSRHDMKPWWEAFHGYSLAASIAVSLTMLYESMSVNVNCRPREYTVGICTTAEVQFMNNYCVSQIPWEMGMFFYMPSIACLLLVILSNWWLYIPRVINAISTFKTALGLLQKSSLPINSIRKMITTPRENCGEEYDKDIIKASLLLRKYIKQGFVKLYLIRNGILSLITLAVCGLFLWRCIVLYQEKPQFNCTDSETFGSPKYICSLNNFRTMNLLLAFFVVTMALQVVFVAIICAISLSKNWKLSEISEKKEGLFSQEFLAKEKINEFLLHFWNHSHPVSSDVFSGFVKYLFTKDALMKISEHVVKRIEYPNLCIDLALLESFLIMQRDASKLVCEYLNEYYRDTVETPENYLVILRKTRFETWCDESRYLASEIYSKKHFGLFVTFLNSFKQEDDRIPLEPSEQECGVDNFDLEDTDDVGNSILFYALEKQTDDPFKSVALQHIVKNTERPRGIIVEHEPVHGECQDMASFLRKHHDNEVTEELERLLVWRGNAEDPNEESETRLSDPNERSALMEV